MEKQEISKRRGILRILLWVVNSLLILACLYGCIQLVFSALAKRDLRTAQQHGTAVVMQVTEVHTIPNSWEWVLSRLEPTEQTAAHGTSYEQLAVTMPRVTTEVGSIVIVYRFPNTQEEPYVDYRQVSYFCGKGLLLGGIPLLLLLIQVIWRIRRRKRAHDRPAVRLDDS